MNILYFGSHSRRFTAVIKQIKGKSVTELCFGDVFIAKYCSNHSIAWLGLDIQPGFVIFAKKKELNAEQIDIRKIHSYPKADTCIMIGSLYHFHLDLETILSKMLSASNHIVLSEPVLNVSHRKDIIGKLAKGMATVRGEKQIFRYTEKSICSDLNKLSQKLNFTFEIVDRFKKDLIIVITK